MWGLEFILGGEGEKGVFQNKKAPNLSTLGAPTVP
jgi:hypothetical protein